MRHKTLTNIEIDVEMERRRAHDKHSSSGKSMEDLPYDHQLWMPVLVEEVGEVARAMNDREPPDRLRTELVQVAAMATAWVAAIDEREG